MSFLDPQINIIAYKKALIAMNQQQTEVAPTFVQKVASEPVFDYVGGVAIILVISAIIKGVFEAATSKPKSKNLSDVEFLEKIWRMDSAKVKD
ncbi:MAG: hypothetical protein SAL70_22375 [Scytonema sp. PMC 1070.18]|nr:hypothetical protein [Scytonema sp. PMC 1070.18]